MKAEARASIRFFFDDESKRVDRAAMKAEARPSARVAA